MSMDRLIEKIVATQNPTVVGLDPKLDYIPGYIKEAAFAQYGYTLEGAAAAFLQFNKDIIDEVCDIVPAIKPQAAYYEALGWQGVKCLYETILYAHSKRMFVITDGKRNDIGSTMEAYADAHLGTTRVGEEIIAPFNGDALTVNGYLGTDGIKPLLDICNRYDKGIFVLAKTSNPSSGELQDREIDGEPVYHYMCRMCESWGESTYSKYGYSAVGAVAGATYPEQLAILRKDMPHTFFLIPGYGAQGGGAAGLVGGFDERGLGGIVNSSRGIICAWKKSGRPETEHALAARDEALRMREDITSHLPKIQL